MTFISGAVRVAGDLSPLAGRTLELTVWAADNGNPRREALRPATAVIFVEKVNRFPPQFRGGPFQATLTLPTIPGVKVLCVSAVDPDDERDKNNTLSGTLVFRNRKLSKLKFFLSRDTQRQHFRLYETSGCLYVESNKNLEKQYNLTVLVSDGALSTSTHIVIVVEEPTPKSLTFTREIYHANVLENSTKNLNLLIVSVANLPLNHHVNYFIMNPNEFLVIRPTSGVIRTTGLPFDRERQEIFSLIVQVN